MWTVLADFLICKGPAHNFGEYRGLGEALQRLVHAVYQRQEEVKRIMLLAEVHGLAHQPVRKHRVQQLVKDTSVYWV